MIDHASCGRCLTARPLTFRSLFHFGKWFAPGAVLLLIPKCPLCIVGYAAMISGVGLSISAAANVRIALIVVSCAGLGYAILRSIIRLRQGFPFRLVQ